MGPGCRIGPPAESAYAVEPVDVATVTMPGMPDMPGMGAIAGMFGGGRGGGGAGAILSDGGRRVAPHHAGRTGARAALGKHFIGFNTGRWDYINSVADAMAWCILQLKAVNLVVNWHQLLKQTLCNQSLCKQHHN